MKRVFLHLIFWLAYLAQDIVLMFLWVEPAMPDISEAKGLWMASYSALVILVPKLLLTYYLIYVTLPRVVRQDNKLWIAAIEAFAMLILSLVLYRILYKYYVAAIIYPGILKVNALLEPKLILQALMDMGFVVGAAVTLKLLRLQLLAKDRQKNLVREKLETELKFLRSQTNPHFLFNTLNNIYALARKQSTDTAEVVMKLSKILRFMLYESKKDHITLAEELKVLEDYIELEKIRYNERLTVSFEKEMDDPSQPVAPLLLLPFVENAFKHGVSESRFGSSVAIQLRLNKGQLYFFVSNSKEDTATDKETGNIGLANTRRQLELMYKDFTLDVENKKERFDLTLTINLYSHAAI